MSIARRLSFALLATVAGWLMVQQANLLLTQIQEEGAQAYGIEALGGGIVPKELTETARSAIDLWRGQGSVGRSVMANRFVIAYMGLDFIFIVAYVCLFWLLMKRLAAALGELGIQERDFALWYTKPLWSSGPRSKRLWPPLGYVFSVLRGVRPLLWLAIFDVLENCARLAVWWTRAQAPALVLVAWAFEKLKFIMLALVLLTIAAAVRDVLTHRARRQQRQPADRRRKPLKHGLAPVQRVAGVLKVIEEPVRRNWHAVIVLRGQVLLAAVFGAALLVDLTGQAADILRRWADGTWSAWVSVLAGAVLISVLTIVLWSSCRRIILAHNDVTAAASTAHKASMSLGWAVVASLVFAAVVGVLTGTLIPLAPLVLLGLLILLEVARAWVGWTFEANDRKAEKETRKAAGRQEGLELETYQRTARVVALIPVAALGLGLVRSAIGPIILSWLPDGGYNFFPFVVMWLAGGVVLYSVCTWLVGLLRRWDKAGPHKPLERRHLVLAGVTVSLIVALAAMPLDVPPAVGSVGTLAIVLAGLGLLFAELQRLSELAVPPRGLTMLGFTRVPVFLLLAAWFVVASVFDDGRHHRIRLIEPPVAPVTTTVSNLWSGWKAANCLDRAAGPVPLVLIATEGGGIRAAYWTASVLTELLADPGLLPTTCPNGDPATRARVFAVSGISGGSVGTTAYLTRPSTSADWYKGVLSEPDYVATPLATGFTVDLPRALIGFQADDRAAWLERAWEHHDGFLKENYFTLLAPGRHDNKWTPLTILNGTQVETGCRVNTSAVRLATMQGPPSNDCRSINGRQPRLPLHGAAEANSSAAIMSSLPAATVSSLPAAPITVDTVACGNSFAVSTAALLSARFPYITPSGQLPCDERIHVVDGGYADGAGTAAVMDLWAQLEPFVAAHNAQIGNGKGIVVPLFVHIDNHYQSPAVLRPPPRTPELLAPPFTRLRAGETRDPGRRQQAATALASVVPGAPKWQCQMGGFAEAGEVLLAPRIRPGLPAPLAWTLAKTSQQDLDEQRIKVFKEEGASLQRLLRGQSSIKCSVTPHQTAGSGRTLAVKTPTRPPNQGVHAAPR